MTIIWANSVTSFNVSTNRASALPIPATVTSAWNAISMSADGTKIYAPIYTGFYFGSFDTGFTWNQLTGSGAGTWVFGWCSSDGSIVYGAQQGATGDFIYKSIDSGTTWNVLPNSGGGVALSWVSVGCSSDGTKVVGVIQDGGARPGLGGFIWVSNDSGATWNSFGTLKNRTWVSVSGDGQKIITGNAEDNTVEISTNGGSSFSAVQSAPGIAAEFPNVCVSRDGSVFYSVWGGNSADSSIYKSINDGSSWTKVGPSWDPGTGMGANWLNISCSSDGSTVLGCSGTITIPPQVSKDSGTSWTPHSEVGANWGVTSDNGMVLVTNGFFGFIYESIDGGSFWFRTSAVG